MLVAALALANAPLVIRMTWERIAESPKGIARSADAARRALRGAAYVETVARAASLLPEDGEYALAKEGGPGPDANWVRCDLAPRKAMLLLPQPCGDWVADRRFARVPELAVVVAKDGGVRIAESRTLLSTLFSGLTGEETEITGWMDEPAPGTTASGRVVVGGWCQERGGKPCASVRVWLDNSEIDPARIERFPRPDVAETVPGIGDCARAGWQTAFEPGTLAPGRHCVAAALIADERRHRRIGPWAFTVAP